MITLKEALTILTESPTYINNSRIMTTIGKCIDNLRAIGYSKYLEEVGSLDYDVFESSRILGQCVFNTEDGTQAIKLNRSLLKEELQDILENNIYHELAHYIQNQICIEREQIVFDEGIGRFISLFSRDDEEYSEHGNLWLSIAQTITSKLSLDIAITPTAPMDIALQVIRKNKENAVGYLICSDASNCGYMVPLVFPNAVRDYIKEEQEIFSQSLFSFFTIICCPKCFKPLLYYDKKTKKMYNIMDTTLTYPIDTPQLADIVKGLDELVYGEPVGEA